MTLTHSLPFCYRSVRIRCNALLLQVGTVLLPSSWPDRSSWLKCSQHLFAWWPSHFCRFRRDCNLRRGWLRAFDCSLLRLDTGSSSILDVSCPTCTAMRLEISILVSQQKARTTNSTQVGSQFSGHRFFSLQVLNSCCNGPANSMSFHAFERRKSTQWNSIFQRTYLLLQERKDPSNRNITSITCKSTSKWLWLQFDWSVGTEIGRITA